MTNLSRIVVLSQALLLAGCMAIPVTSVEEDRKAKLFSPEPNKASVYIYWEGSVPINFETAIMALEVNGHPLGALFTGTFFHLNLMPGKYLIESHGYVRRSRREAPGYLDSPGYASPFVFPIVAEAGKQYFLQQEGDSMKGSNDWNRLSLVNDASGRAGVKAAKMISSRILDGDLAPLESGVSVLKLPLSVGVYYSPEFSNASKREKRPLFFGSEPYEIPVGLASKWTLERALENKFKHVSVLAEWPPSVAVREMDLFLVPHLAETKKKERGGEVPSINYFVSVYASNGGEISTIEVKGFALDHSWSGAIGSAAAQLVTSLEKLPEVANHVRNMSQLAVPPTDKAGKSQSFGSQKSRGVAVVPLVEKPESVESTKELLECLEYSIPTRNPKLNLVPGSLVRDVAFPWLEAGMTPSRETLEVLLAQTPVAKRLEQIGAQFIVFPTIRYKQEFGGPFMCAPGGCIGVAGGSQSTQFAVSVWDVAAGAMLSTPIAGEKKGVSWVAGYIIPIWHRADTLGETCTEIVEGIISGIEP